MTRTGNRAVAIGLACLAGIWTVGRAHAAGVARQDTAGDEARKILAETGVTGGLIVHVGCGEGNLTAALCAEGPFVVEGLDGNAAHVEAARKHFQEAGLSEKVWAGQWEGPHLPYANNLVNLLVSEDLGNVPMNEVTRVLAPLGVACLKGRDGVWTKTVKPWPDDIDEWTHYLHGPDNNAVARDRVAGPPACAQWIEGPRWYQHHEMNANPEALVSAKGRIFYIVNESPATVGGLPDEWVVASRDAFNGMLLWTRPVPDWGWTAWGNSDQTDGRFALPLEIQRRLVAGGDRVFATLGFNAPLTALDAATGKTIKTYEGTQGTDEILYCDGLLILTVNETAYKSGSDAPPSAKRIMVLNAETGGTLWAKSGYGGVSAAASNRKVPGVTRLLLAVGDGKVVGATDDALIAFDLKTGRELWQKPRLKTPVPPGKLREPYDNFSSLVIAGDVTLFLQTEQSYQSGDENGNAGVGCRLFGISSDTGQPLWEQPCSKWGPGAEGDLFVIDGLAWTWSAGDGYSAIGIDLHGGQIERTFSAKDILDEVHHHRCYRNKATESYLWPGRRGIETIDLQTGENCKNQWVRGTCRYGIMPCNGLVYAPPHACACYIEEKLSGFYALASEAAASRGGPAPATGGRTEHGPAYGRISNLESQPSNPQDWPTYRHDARRSGSTPANAPTSLQRLWGTRLATRVSACTVASGRVYAAAVDQHRVVAMDEKDGHVLWDYVANGRVDTPPTFFNGLLLFGSADGWVYCLRASDGALVWRFQAAPNERRIMAFGQPESPWPVHGTVLVSGGVAYIAAGRSNHLDGGIRVFALKPETGELIKPLRPLDETTGGLEDVLVSDGTHVFMRQLEFTLAEAEVVREATASRNRAATQDWRAFSTAGLLDDSCFSRVGWSTGKTVGKLGDLPGADKRTKAASKRAEAKVGKKKVVDYKVAQASGSLAKAADLLVFDDQTAYCFRTRRQGTFGGWFDAGTGAYELAALDPSGEARWTNRMPLRVRAMAAAGPTLFAAGGRDVVNPDDPWASIEGRAGGVLVALSKEDGKKLAEFALDQTPRWDGMAAANGKLFIVNQDGGIECWGAK